MTKWICKTNCRCDFRSNLHLGKGIGLVRGIRNVVVGSDALIQTYAPEFDSGLEGVLAVRNGGYCRS